MADLYDFPDIYDERFTEGANQAYKEHYQKMFAGKEIRTLLDCSFGTGNLTFPLAELGYQVTGSDISAEMLKKAGEKAAEKGLSVELAQCDFREISGRFDRPFDCVMSTGNALAHVSNEDVLKTVHEMDRCLRPGGYFYFDSRNWEMAQKNRQRFLVPQPFYQEDGTRIGNVQVWDYHEDGAITIHILNSYEKDGKIFKTNQFEEHLQPFSVSLVKEELERMGYAQFEIKPCPWFDDKPFSETGWYCLMAKKPCGT